jgi:hypothetical protein
MVPDRPIVKARASIRRHEPTEPDQIVVSAGTFADPTFPPAD